MTIPLPPAAAIPTDLGHDAYAWLEAHGLCAISPDARSSDYDLILESPFLYYLTRRLGLARILSHSEAITRGSWFHSHYQFPTNPFDQAFTLLSNRITELRQLCKTLGIVGDSLTSILNEETRRFHLAAVQYRALLEVPISPSLGTVDQFFSRSYWRLLGCELRLSAAVPGLDMTISGDLDRLYYHTVEKALYICDPKTCSDSAKLRLSTCPIEMQTWQYLHLVKWNLPTLIERYSLPPDTKVGPMCHIACVKCPLTLAQKDRALIGYQSEGKKTGIRGRCYPEGQSWICETSVVGAGRTSHPTPEAARDALHLATGKTPDPIHSGEPSPAIYHARCMDWYLGKGEYESERPLRESDPPFNISFTDPSWVLDTHRSDDYIQRLKLIRHYSHCPPLPYLVPANPRRLREHGKLSPFFHFHVEPVHKWPDLLRKQGLAVIRRETQDPTNAQEEN